MKRKLFQASALVLAVLLAGVTQAAVSVDFVDPGWTYEYTGDAAVNGEAPPTPTQWSSLDGTWDHFNGSDAWDGTAIGAGGPGGVSAPLTDGSATYARLQDPGDTRGNGFTDPSDPNRKLYFGQDISAAGDTVLDDGVTISFRAKIATGSPLDDHYTRNAGGATTPWPAGGDGYQNFSNGRGMFGVNQKANSDGEMGADANLKPARIGFSLVNSLDLGGAWGDDLGGLMMNDLDSNTISEDVDLGEGQGGSGAGVNFISITDASLNDWHEFWITIEADASSTGTHEVVVYMDGSLAGSTFLATAGYDSSPGEKDYDLSFMSMGMGSSGAAGAYDVDFFAYKAGVMAPVPEPSALLLTVLACAGWVGLSQRRRLA